MIEFQFGDMEIEYFVFSILKVITIRKNYTLAVGEQNAGVEQSVNGKNLLRSHIKNIGAEVLSIRFYLDRY